jgi:transcriptional regulator with GAF, ATPase, and Fis domain
VTRAEVRRLERANIEAALAATRGKIFGDDGAARLLGMRPTTLASRIKALGIFCR